MMSTSIKDELCNFNFKVFPALFPVTQRGDPYKIGLRGNYYTQTIKETCCGQKLIQPQYRPNQSASSQPRKRPRQSSLGWLGNQAIASATALNNDVNSDILRVGVRIACPGESWAGMLSCIIYPDAV